MTQRNGRRSVRVKPVRDGYTLQGQIPPLPGVHDGLAFQYRVAIPERVVEYLQANKTTPKKTVDAMVALLAEHVTGWEEDCPVTEQALRDTMHPVLLAMVDHVTGYAPAELEADLKNSATASP